MVCIDIGQHQLDYWLEYDPMKLFALNGSEQLGQHIADELGIPLCAHEERHFAGGESKGRPLENVQNENIFVLHSLNGTSVASANDKLCRLLFFIAACKENGAQSVSAIVPYLAYCRKDRQTKSNDPVTIKYVAQLFDAVGTDAVVTLEAHNVSAFQNAFRCRQVSLDAARLMADLVETELAVERPVVVSPDSGGVKRAEQFRRLIESRTGNHIELAFVEKHRSAGVVSGSLFAGDVKDADVFIVDDIISSGGTMLKAAHACWQRGAKSINLLAAHGLFEDGYERLIEDPSIGTIWVSDSVVRPTRVLDHGHDKVSVISIAPLLAETIRSLDTGLPVSVLQAYS